MNEARSTARPGGLGDPTGDVLDMILAGMLRDLEGAADRPAVVARYCGQYPEHAEEIRATIATMDLVGTSRGEADGLVSRRLGDFRIVRRLARGGMGEIFEAIQEPLGRRVAVKTIRDSFLAASAEVRDRFLREQTALARLHHTHIVPIHAAGQEGHIHYFAMPYIEGAALSHVVESVRDHGPRSGSTPTLAELAARLSATGGDACPSTASVPRVPPPDPGAPEELSLPYFRSVARVLAAAAEAVQHAHDAQILHRDLKPSNLMVDRHEHCWVLDFGLARFRDGRPGDDTPPPEADVPSSGRMGTPLYMAPEQYDLRADERSDVWGLGVTLYELLTLRRAFASPAEVERADPTPPRRHVPNLPPDLEAICLKAFRKDPSHRYPTARALADDLRRWLGDEPTSARPAPVARKVRLWSRRNPGWAAAVVLTALAIVGAGAGAALVYKMRADAARKVANVAIAGKRDERRESLMEHIVRIRMTPHAEGWSSEAWDLVGKAAGIRADDRLRSQAAATLAGLDARRVKEFDTGATALAFDRDGKRLLIGGTRNGLLLWHRATDRMVSQGQALDGPFASRADGTVVQLGSSTPGRDRRNNLRFPLQIWNATTGGIDGTFVDPIEGGSLGVAAWAISAEASRVGAVVVMPDETRVLVVWDAGTGAVVRKLAHSAVDLAFTPDAKVLAAWDESGHIDLWGLPAGERIATLSSGTNPVRAVEFGPNHWRRGGPAGPEGRWLLAAGEAGGTVTIWDLQLRVPRAICRGSEYEIFALAFSPDGTTLASAGRMQARLWDVATGQPLLDLPRGNLLNVLAFSPDGDILAVARAAGFGEPEGVTVWALERDRGVKTMRGLGARAEKATFSRDGRLVAGVSQDWRVAIWDRETGRLRRMLDVPQGGWADNCGLAFSPDGRRFAFSAGRRAKLWDVESGEELDRWDLPPGLEDALAFQGPDRLVLLRTETRDGKARPYRASDPRDHPRVCPLRVLRPGGVAETIATITDFNWQVHLARVSPDGMFFLIEGLGGPGGKTRTVNAYNAAGDRLWALPSQVPLDHASGIRLDPAGEVFCLGTSLRPPSLYESKTRAILADFDERGVLCMGPRGTRWAGLSSADDRPIGVWIAERGREDRLVKIPIPGTAISNKAEFSPDGLALAWANSDGTVTLCDLPEIQRRLAGVGMGW